jgi:hypothetical protein
LLVKVAVTGKEMTKSLCPHLAQEQPCADQLIVLSQIKYLGETQLSFLTLQIECQNQQRNVRRHTQRREQRHHIPTRPKLCILQPILADFRKELLVPLLPPEHADEQNAGTVRGKQRADAVELGREDLEHDERKRELAQRRSDVGAFKGALRRADFYQFVAAEDDGLGAVLAEPVACDCVSTLEVSSV